MIKKIIPVVLILAFLATIPALYQNNRRVGQVKAELKKVLDISKKICKSDCTEYPSDWVNPSSKIEGELYCMRQCNNNMRGIREGLLDDFPVLFTNQYTYRVAQLYCILGLACPQLQITEFIEGY